MSRPVSPHEVQALLDALPRWWPWLVAWGVRWANDGPKWVPHALRSVPLRLAGWLASVYARGLA